MLACGQPRILHETLNFEDAFAAAPAARVFPLLAEHDQFIRYRRQSASYGDVPVIAADRGHVTAVTSPAPLREHLGRCLSSGEYAG
ncbi:MAG TPA: hypothetical protein VKA04_00295 [Pseudodesulfovibrio sp.]|nr:hypothetical protein [Pseudodesulfovibrio sp.]